jgi:thiamine transport system substrate-binding protein
MKGLRAQIPLRKNFLAFLSALLIFAGACTAGNPPDQPLPTVPVTSPEVKETRATGGTLTIMTHDSFSVSENVVQAFENQTGVNLVFIQAGDAGTALNKAILSKGNPIADVFYGVDNTFLSRALTEDIFEPYASPKLENIPKEFKLDSQNRALPVDYGDVCLNYDKAYFEGKGIAPPQNLEDLLKAEYKDLLVVENPATSSPGLAFLLATVGRFGADQYLDYWKGLVANGVLVVNDWETAYYTEFSRSGGARPIVVSYGSSPAFEVINAGEALNDPPTGAVAAEGSCFRQIEFVGILKGTQNVGLAQKWVDFMLSTAFQEDMPLQMYVFPVNPQAALNETFSQFLAAPDQPADVDPQEIAANREKWIKEWTATVLR